MRRPPRNLFRPTVLLRPARRDGRLRIAAVRWLALAALLTLLGPLQAARAAPALASTITLTPSLPSGQPVGTPITWTAVATGFAQPVYRFSVEFDQQSMRVARDYSPKNYFLWAPLRDGTYTIQVTVKDGFAATATTGTSTTFTVVSRVPQGSTTPVVSPTANPLIALFSAPPCSAGIMLVAFRAVGGTSWSFTNEEPCEPGLSQNFWVAGMLASTTYQMLDVVVNGATITKSPVLSFTTGAVPTSLTFPAFSVPVAPTAQSDVAESVLWNALAQSSPTTPDPIATDLQGRILWYYNPPAPTDITAVFPTRIVPGGPVFVLGRDSAVPIPGSTVATSGTNVLREIDLAGYPLRETNVAAVNAQLTAQGKEVIYGFHHDVLPLPNGDTATLGFTLKYFTINGTSTPYMSDMLIVLDRNLQVVWTWDAFNYVAPNGPLSLTRQPIPGTCAAPYPPGFCPVPVPNALDWTHANSISYSPLDGDLVVSLRNQNWVAKIAYANGAGDGHIIWLLGLGGNFTLVPANPADPYPWFSGQHDAHYVDNGRTLTLFDDGNTRCTSSTGTYIPGCFSRGQAYVLNEQTMVATQTVNVDLGNYSFALGSAERESNGNYDFTSGFQIPTPPGPPFGQTIEVLPSGAKVYVQQVQTIEYRSYRMADLYRGTKPECPSCPLPS